LLRKESISERRIKVLHVVGGMNAAGLETLIMNIYRNIDRNNVQFDFAVQTTEKCFYDDEIMRMGGKIIPHPKPKNSINKYKNALKKTLVENGSYDAVHSHVLFFSGIVLSVAKELNIPVRIAHSHSTSDSKDNSIYRKLYRYMMRREILNNATHLLGCSIEACKYVFGNSSISMHYPNAIDLKEYKDLNKNKSYLTNELKISSDSVILGHIGRFTKPKNHVFIIELFSYYLKKNPKAHLVLVGDGNERENIERLVYKKNIVSNVHFLGLRKDISSILSSIDIFLFPSLYEGLGIVLIEAQAASVPCLISDVIPKEADLKIGLVRRLNLSVEAQIWAEAIEETLKTGEKDWGTIESALKDNGYDIISTSKKLIRIYSGEK
jgi:glycosyltransferase involved in cell wall biosynthesis